MKIWLAARMSTVDMTQRRFDNALQPIKMQNTVWCEKRIKNMQKCTVKVAVTTNQ